MNKCAHIRRTAMSAGLMLSLVATAPAALAWPARVLNVTDGDTLTVKNRNTLAIEDIRLSGIDTPEVDHGPGHRGQPFGENAKNALASLVDNRMIDVQPNGAKSYDRTVARVSVDGNDVGEALVRQGMAWQYPAYDPNNRYGPAQQAARRANRGLWSQAEPIAPWRWRAKYWND